MGELRRVVGVLEGLACGKLPSCSTLELRLLADSLRGLATWGLDD